MPERSPTSQSSTPFDDAIHVLDDDGSDTLCGLVATAEVNAVGLYEAHEHGVDPGDGCWTCIEKMEKHR